MAALSAERRDSGGEGGNYPEGANADSLSAMPMKTALTARPAARPMAAAAADSCVPIVFCADANYGNYLPVVLQSIIEHASPQRHYHIIILDCGIADIIARAVDEQLRPYSNFSFEIRDISNFLEQYKAGFRERLHYTRAMYGRLFIPEIFPEYKRLIYTDIDVVFERDIAELMQLDLTGCYIGAVKELAVELERVADRKNSRYIQDILHLAPDVPCIYSGLLVFNTEIWRRDGITDKIIHFLQDKKLRCPDQDAITAICRDKVAYLGQDWTCVVLKERIERFARLMPPGRFPALEALRAEWQAACVSGRAVIHYNGAIKPWNSLHLFLGEKWWHYARETKLYPYYNHQLIAAQARHGLPLKVYRLFGLPVWQVKTTPNEVKYLLGKYRIAKKMYKGSSRFIYIFGIKVLSISDG